MRAIRSPQLRSNSRGASAAHQRRKFACKRVVRRTAAGGASSHRPRFGWNFADQFKIMDTCAVKDLPTLFGADQTVDIATLDQHFFQHALLLVGAIISDEMAVAGRSVALNDNARCGDHVSYSNAPFQPRKSRGDPFTGRADIA